LSDDGHRITVLAPPDDSVADLERIGCRFRPLEMNVKGLNPVEDLKPQRRLKRIFREEQPDAILSFTIKNNIFGAWAARAAGVPFVPNVTGLGTAFLSGGLLQTIAEQLYRRAFGKLPIVFFQNEDDRDLFLDRKLVRADQARLLPGSGIDLIRFTAAEMLSADAPPVFLMIARLLRDKGVIEFVEASLLIKACHPEARFQLLGATGLENRTAIDAAAVEGWVVEGVVEYLGTTNDVRPAIAAASCVVQPVEGFLICPLFVAPDQVTDVLADVFIGPVIAYIGRHEVTQCPTRADGHRGRSGHGAVSLVFDVLNITKNAQISRASPAWPTHPS
jgi:glycosyltransferase involved in cell wall biosynthesis